MACRILVLRPQIESGRSTVLTTGNSHYFHFLKKALFFLQNDLIVFNLKKKFPKKMFFIALACSYMESKKSLVTAVKVRSLGPVVYDFDSGFVLL